MTPYTPRPLQDVFRDALRTLEAEPDRITPDKAELIEFLRQRIAENEAFDRSRTH